jgi:RNA polymerase sigma-70 factor (ECF subfamily)
MDPEHALPRLYRDEYGRVVATLIRVVGDFGLAEEIAQDAFAAAVEQWSGAPPQNARAWLFRTARNKAIDALRRRVRFDEKRAEIEGQAALEEAPPDFEPEMDDRLRLIFTCCHPALARESQVALTLRTLGGLTTEEIARAFLVPAPTMAQRLVRAQKKIRDAKIPYRVPEAEEMPERIESVMAVVYLVFNEGYAASSGDAWVRRDLCAEAIRLGRLLVELVPDASEARALLALMLLHDSRREARESGGEIVLLEEQDRSRWDRAQIAEGLRLTEEALRAGPAGPYALQAAVAAVHARAARAGETDWRQIASLYALIAERYPSPVVELNRAVAVAMAEGAERGLLLVEALAARGDLDSYHLLHAARADLLRRLGRRAEAAEAYRRALALAGNEAEKRFLMRRLGEVEPAS